MRAVRDHELTRSVSQAQRLVAAVNAELQSGSGDGVQARSGLRKGSGAAHRPAASFGGRLAALTVSESERDTARAFFAPQHAEDEDMPIGDSPQEPSPADWLAALRLDKFIPSFTALGVTALVDFLEVQESDLEALPVLQRRRFTAAAAALRPHTAPRPNASAPPAAWLAYLRLEAFASDFDSQGVQVAADFVDVTDEDLDAMHMPPLAQRRFRAGRPDVGGAAAAAKAAAARAAASSPGVRVSEWLNVLRLASFARSLIELGVEDVEDMAEVPTHEIIDMGMPPLAQRRFTLAASRVAQRPGGSPLGPEAAVTAAATEAAACRDAREWLDVLRLGGYAALFMGNGSLGVEHPWDFKEVTADDVDNRMRMPPLQRARFFAAAAATPGPPPLGGALTASGRNRAQAGGQAAVTAWLAAARLTRYQSALVALGVTQPLCCAELIVPDDLDALDMPPLHQRRFTAAVQALGPDAKAMQPPGLDATPIAWLVAIRCDAHADAFTRLGVSCAADFAEVLLSDLSEIGLPLLHRRRFAHAAASTQSELKAGRRDAAACLAAAASARDVPAWLDALRLGRLGHAFEALGVERVDDMAEVLPNDLADIGMRPLETRRFKHALLR